MKNRMKIVWVFVFCVISVAQVFAQAPTQVKESIKELSVTHVISVNHLTDNTQCISFKYFLFDGFALRSQGAYCFDSQDFWTFWLGVQKSCVSSDFFHGYVGVDFGFGNDALRGWDAYDLESVQDVKYYALNIRPFIGIEFCVGEHFFFGPEFQYGNYYTRAFALDYEGNIVERTSLWDLNVGYLSTLSLNIGFRF